MNTVYCTLEETTGNAPAYFPFDKQVIDQLKESQRAKEIQALVVWKYKKHGIPFFSPGASYGRRFCEWLNSYYQENSFPYEFLQTESFKEMATEIEHLASPLFMFTPSERLTKELETNPSAELVISDKLLNERGRQLLVKYLQLPESTKNIIRFHEPKLIS